MGGGVETESIHSDAFQEMPKSSQQDYYFKEKVFLQQLQSAGHVLDNYYLAFSTSKITQADIDKRYDEYDTDMGNFDAEILKTKKNWLPGWKNYWKKWIQGMMKRILVTLR